MKRKTTRKRNKSDLPARTRAWINGLVEGEEVDEVYAIRNLGLHEGGQAGQYITFRLFDATGEVRGVYWPDRPGEAERLTFDLEDGELVQIKGRVVSYRNAVEIRVDAGEGSFLPLKGERAPKQYAAPSFSSTKRERDTIAKLIDRIHDKDLKRLACTFLSDAERERAYFSLPSIRDDPSGPWASVASQAASVAQTARSIATGIRGMDLDLLTCGALFAPAGAVSAIRFDGLVLKRTVAGMLLGQDYLSASLIEQVAAEANDIPGEVLTRLLHVVLGATGWVDSDPLLHEAIVLRHSMEVLRETGNGIGWTKKGATVPDPSEPGL